jgi:hypothetical protein
MIQFGVKLLRRWEERDLFRMKLLTSSEAYPSGHNLLGLTTLGLFTNAAVLDDAIKFLTEKSSCIKPELEKHKVDDAVTVDKKHSNDIQKSEEEDNKQQQPTTNTVF